MTGPATDLEAAADRADRALAEIERLDMAAFGRLSLSLRDAEERAPTREMAVRAAEKAGHGVLLAERRAAAREYVIHAFDTAPFRAIGVDLGESRSRSSVDDRVAVMLAVEDALIAAIAEPFLSADDHDRLATPFEQLRPAWAEGDPLPPALAERHIQVTRWSMYVVLGLIVLGSLLLLLLGSSVGLFGLAAAIGIVLVALVVRGRPAS